MRMRSCQLVYLLLLLCSVQGLDARAVGMLGAGSIGAVASSRDLAQAEGRTGQARAQVQDAEQAAEPAMWDAMCTPLDRRGPAAHAAATAMHTSFSRG